MFLYISEFFTSSYISIYGCAPFVRYHITLRAAAADWDGKAHPQRSGPVVTSTDLHELNARIGYV
jgi:hypothetical protein